MKEVWIYVQTHTHTLIQTRIGKRTRRSKGLTLHENNHGRRQISLVFPVQEFHAHSESDEFSWCLQTYTLHYIFPLIVTLVTVQAVLKEKKNDLL